MNYINIKPRLLVFLLLTSLATVKSFSQHTDVINSNRPGKSMMAFSVGKSVIQVETGIFGIKEEHSLLGYNANGFGLDFTARWGVFKEELEVVAELQYQNDTYQSPIRNYDRSALRTTVFGAKYLLYDPYKYYVEKVNIKSWKANQKFKWRQLIPAVSVFVGANINFSDNPFNYNSRLVEEKISPKILVATQNTFGTRWVLVTNLIYDKFTSDYKNLGGIVTLTHGINQKWSAFLEAQAYSGNLYSDGVFRVGGAYLLNKSMQIDASFSKNIKNTPALTYGGIGFSWRFEKNYKDVLIKTPENYKKDKANKSAKGGKDKETKELPTKKE